MGSADHAGSMAPASNGSVAVGVVDPHVDRSRPAAITAPASPGTSTSSRPQRTRLSSRRCRWMARAKAVARSRVSAASSNRYEAASDRMRSASGSRTSEASPARACATRSTTKAYSSSETWPEQGQVATPSCAAVHAPDRSAPAVALIRVVHRRGEWPTRRPRRSGARRRPTKQARDRSNHRPWPTSRPRGEESVG